MMLADHNPEQLSCMFASIRDDRRHFFSADLCTEPAWDMLLLLHCSSLKEERLGVSRVATVGGCPFTTGLRWLKVLEDRGLVVRGSHPTDGRSVLVELTPAARVAMIQYLERIASDRSNIPAAELKSMADAQGPSPDDDRRRTALPLMEQSLQLLDPVNCPGAALLDLAITRLKEDLQATASRERQRTEAV